jgi:carboxyl-terminal processing protease
VVSQRGRTKDDIERYYARPGDMAHGLPVIVLTDAGTASASEIVAGALQDHHRALIMGETSFGKGSVQTVVQTGPDAALRLTTARYYTPSGRSVQAGGIQPDIEVPQLTDPDYKDRRFIREADLRRHLLAQTKVDAKLLESDDTPDPRFTAKADDLKKEGVKDFQLYYALNTLKRLAAPSPAAIASGAAPSKKSR